MPLPNGTRLGPYEIAALLGAGGMGEVYRARDSRLDRTVALKVLSADLRERPEERAGLIARFEREARAVAALNHPHICALYDIGQDHGIDFLGMEYLEGETLAERLTRGALPVDQLLRYAIQIADAIERAHRQGLVHRDLKPGNIMLTKTGAKLLDFGLAKTVSVFKPASGETATLTRALSADGAILGTLQYMPPEQLEGKEADARSDIFAFGAVLYEMATGSRAFEASSQASLIAAILERDRKSEKSRFHVGEELHDVFAVAVGPVVPSRRKKRDHVEPDRTGAGGRNHQAVLRGRRGFSGSRQRHIVLFPVLGDPRNLGARLDRRAIVADHGGAYDGDRERPRESRRGLGIK
ncbi:hypothetical protein SBA6_520010 [Candidatus Sulfopaludibacter sp. SbA6]|nr:hypothetical protein SBA6_520010 [Candidatus Sulfopaludibacter sp. SbA6]